MPITFSLVRGQEPVIKCECADNKCDQHLNKGFCKNNETCTVVRPDFNFAELKMCSNCAADAVDSGYFFFKVENQEDDDEQVEVK